VSNKVIVFLVICATMMVALLLYVVVVALDQNGGCWLRYDPNGSSAYSSSISLRASGRYEDIPCQQDNSCLDNTRYAKWLKVDSNIIQGDELIFAINGDVSLCGSTYSQDSRPIPQVDILHEGGLSITLDPAKTKGYIYLAKMEKGDKVKITVGENSSSMQSRAPGRGRDKIVDCDKGLDGKGEAFHPACNRFSPYVGADFTITCKSDQKLKQFSKCDQTASVKGCDDNPQDTDARCQDPNVTCLCRINSQGYDSCESESPCPEKSFSYDSSCRISSTRSLPDIYSFDKIYTSNTKIFTPQDLLGGIDSCAGLISENDEKSWFAFQAQDASGKNTKTFSGLYYTIVNTSSNNKLAPKALEIIEDKADTPPEELNGSALRTLSTRVIFEDRIHELPKGKDGQNYFAVYFHNFQNSTKYTGGYTVYLKHTGCYRRDGEYWSTPYQDKGTTKYANKGQIRYLILDSEHDPNKTPSLAAGSKALNFDKQTSNALAYDTGYLWMRVENNLADYKNSTGVYNIAFSKTSPKPKRHETGEGIFAIITEFAKQIRAMSQQIFQNLICRGDGQKDATCGNLFTSIRAMLGIYVVILGMQFTFGMVKINQLDFLERLVKVIIVGGLINDNTFNFFNEYVFDLVFSSGDQIMGSINGLQGNVGQNLDRFFFEIYDKFASKIFILQLAAQLGSGISAVVTFLIISISIIIFLIVIMEFIVVYVMSYVGLAILISLAPIFLVFMLFKVTHSLFENWVKFVVRYMFEPVIFFIGISVLTKIFLIYVDYVLGYSVCWKCSMTFSVPFIGSFVPILKSLETMPLFCMYWYGPWGYDAMNSSFGASLSHVAAMFIIAFTTLKYSSVSSEICSRIFGGGQSIKSAQELASDAIEKPLAKGVSSMKSSGKDPS
jgi:type IV secretion system protein VirB6